MASHQDGVGFHGFEDLVEDPGVDFLDAGGGGAGDDNFVVGQALGFAAVS
jgi:hypothetical protein